MTGLPPVSFSLPTQRCFHQHSFRLTYGFLFSAYAEVFLNNHKTIIEWESFLCLRRGVSNATPPLTVTSALFSAYAEVFPRSCM